MTINRRHTGRFLFLTALLLKVVISEGSDYERSCSIDDMSLPVKTTTGEANVTFEHPVRPILTPDKDWIYEFDLSLEDGWPKIMPLKIVLGRGVNNKESNNALQTSIIRVGEIIESSAGPAIPGIFSAPDQNDESYVNTKAALDYIFQDTYQTFDKRINRVLIEPKWRVSLHENDDKHRFGNIWAMIQPSPDKNREIGFLVAYLDQGIYLLIHEHGFKFLDLGGFRKLIEVTLGSWYTWQSATLAPKSMTWSQWFYFLSGYLPSTNNMLNWLGGHPKEVALVTALAIVYSIDKFSDFLYGSDTSSNRRQPEAKKPEAKKTEAKKPEDKKAGYSKSDDMGASCEEYCRSDAPLAQSDQKQEERLRQQEARRQLEEKRLRQQQQQERLRQQQQEEEQLRQQRILQLRLDITNQAIIAELDRESLEVGAEERIMPNQEEFLRRTRVINILSNRLYSGWTIEELIAAIFEKPDLWQLRKLRWIFKRDSEVPPKLRRFKEALDETR